MAAIFLFISTLYLKQQTNILRCFCSLKFENSLFSNKLFRCIFRSERKIYTAENDQIKYFVQNQLVKVTFLMCKILFDFDNTINYVSVSLWSLSKDIFTNLGTAGSWYVIDSKRPLLPHYSEYIL